MAQDDTLYHYNSDGWTFSWNTPEGPLDLTPALIQGSYLTEAREAMTYTSEALLTGAVVRSHAANKQLTVSFAINQSHPIHKRLLELSDLDTGDGPRNIVGDLTCVLVGAAGAEVRRKIYVNAYIESSPDESDDIKSSQVTWVFRANRVKKDFNQNNAEVVGNS